jgi:pre-mRNA-splicing factor ATP-dependent RNA helicase DHX15/PRP43
MREFISDPDIRDYGIVLIDEAHERTVNSDIIIGLLKQILDRRSDLRVVVMSATLEASKFTAFFAGSPHLIVPGRLYPIEIYHEQESVRDYVESAISRALKIHRDEGPGDILVFLTGEEEIEAACERIRAGIASAKVPAVVLPLYSSLPPRDQQRAFAPQNRRKIIVSTNIAETSVTIDGVAFVVDPGFVKQSIYQSEHRLSALLVTPISQAAATQRSGRAGRTCPGKCYRLYTEESFAELQPQTIPEIQRSDLATVVLTVLSAGVRDLVNFPFIDAPPMVQLATAVAELFHLGALDAEARLTPVGRQIAALPVEPKLAKVVVAASRFGCTAEATALVAMLAEQGQVFMRPRKSQSTADSAHSMFKNTWGDHIALVNVFESFIAVGSDKKWCDDNFLNFRVLSRAEVARGQMYSILRGLDLPIVGIDPGAKDREKCILRALLEGMYIQVAMLNPSSKGYLLVDSVKEVIIHPSSCIVGRKPQWVVFGSYVFTSQDYIRTVSEIQPEWLFEAAPTFFAQDKVFHGLVEKTLAAVRSRVAERTRFK